MKDIFDRVNLTEVLVVVFAGAALLAAIILRQETIASAIGGGLVGYLGAVVPMEVKDK